MKKYLSLLLAIVMVLSLAACGSTSTTTTASSDTASTESDASAVDGDAYTKINISIANGAAETTSMNQSLVYLKEILEERSGGVMTVDLYPNQQLGNDREITEAVTQGNITAAVPSSSPVAGFVPELNVLDAPWLFSDRASVYEVLDSEAGQQLLTYLSEANMIGLGYMENGIRHLTSTKEINSMDDLKGLKIRVMENDVHMASWKALGANPTPMNFGEVYTALQQKTIDAQENPMELNYNTKFYEVCPYVYLTGHVYTAYIFVMNLDAWNSLNEASQQLLQECVNEAIQKNREIAETSEQECIDAINASGVSTVLEVSDELKAEMAQACVDAGVYDTVRELAGEEVSNAFFEAAGFEG